MASTTGDAFDQFYAPTNLTGGFRVTANARRDWVLQRLRGIGVSRATLYVHVNRIT